jgi:Uma2 family endonuclease
MVISHTKFDIEYPESDGRPMGETDLHRDLMVRILELFRWRYRNERVYVASDLLVYYQEGDPKKFVVPDDFVVLNCEPGQRRTFKIWEEGRVPDVVFEVTSRSSRTADQVHKPRVYARIGVQEYFLYDPTSDYLDVPLQGFRLGEGGKYNRIEADTDGSLHCETLGLALRLVDQQLQMFDRQTGERLRTAVEAGDEARQAAERALRVSEDARQVAEDARRAAESRAAQLELELKNERLRTEQRDKHGGD